MVCCALESVSVAPLLASWWTAAALRRAVGTIANRSMAVPRAGCSLLVSWALVEPSRISLSNEVTVAYTLHDPRCRYTIAVLLHRQRPTRSFASPYAELHVRQRLCTARATRLARGERLQSSKRQAWRRLYADLCGRLSVYAIDPSSECIPCNMTLFQRVTSHNRYFQDPTRTVVSAPATGFLTR